MLLEQLKQQLPPKLFRAILLVVAVRMLERSWPPGLEFRRRLRRHEPLARYELLKQRQLRKAFRPLLRLACQMLLS